MRCVRLFTVSRLTRFHSKPNMSTGMPNTYLQRHGSVMSHPRRVQCNVTYTATMGTPMNNIQPIVVGSVQDTLRSWLSSSADSSDIVAVSGLNTWLLKATQWNCASTHQRSTQTVSRTVATQRIQAPYCTMSSVRLVRKGCIVSGVQQCAGMHVTGCTRDPNARARTHIHTHTHAHRVAPSHTRSRTRSHTRTKHHNERHQHAVSRAHLQVRSAARRCSPRRGWAWRCLPRIVHISLAARGGSSSSSGSPSLGSPALGSEASTSPQFPAHGTHSLRIAYHWHCRVGSSTALPAASDAPEYGDATCDGDGQGRNAQLCDKEARAVVLQQAIQAKQRLARAVATTMAQP